MVKFGSWPPNYVPNISQMQFATEAAITILRIDDMIKLMKDEGQNDQD
jgi:hypothetical protein